VNRFYLRQDLTLLHAVILFDKEADDVTRDHLRGNVDNVRLDEGVVGDGVGESVAPPTNAEERRRDRYPSGGAPDGPPNEARQGA
jgi:hypothetical protein